MHPEFLYVAVALDKSALMVTGAPNNWDTSALAALQLSKSGNAGLYTNWVSSLASAVRAPAL